MATPSKPSLQVFRGEIACDDLILPIRDFDKLDAISRLQLQVCPYRCRNRESSLRRQLGADPLFRNTIFPAISRYF